VLQEIALRWSSTLIISIAAGASLGAIASILAKEVRLVRAMQICRLALESATAFRQAEVSAAIWSKPGDI